MKYLTSIYIYNRNVCPSVCLSITSGREMAEEAGRVDWKEWDMGRGDFTDGMPGWTNFSRATPGHPASNAGKNRGVTHLRFFYPPTKPPANLPVRPPPIHPPIWSVSLPVCLSFQIAIRPSVCLSLHPSVHLFI